jgi:hypothetical protein
VIVYGNRPPGRVAVAAQSAASREGEGRPLGWATCALYEISAPSAGLLGAGIRPALHSLPVPAVILAGRSRAR